MAGGQLKERKFGGLDGQVETPLSLNQARRPLNVSL